MADVQATKHGWRFKDLNTMRFGRLTVVRYAGVTKKKTYWVCACDCGKEKTIESYKLTIGETRSCGCLRTETTVKRSTKHGNAPKTGPSGEYICWLSMKTRCEKEDSDKYHCYGGRGVRVCERWSNSFEAFLADMGPRPSLDYSLDRYPNNDGNYEPGNCRWATRFEQARNKRNTVNLTLEGQAMCLADWAKRIGIRRGTLRARINRGWTHEKALTTPVGVPNEETLESNK